MVDLAPGSELLVSYLSFEEISQPTADRRESLRGCKWVVETGERQRERDP